MTVAAILPVEPDATVEVPTGLFGSLTLRPADLWSTPHGLPGFASARGWALLPVERTRTAWLQSIEHADLAFLVVPCGVVHATAWAELRDAWLVVTLPRSAGTPTANLRAPLVFDRVTRTVRQFVPERSAWSVREPVSLAQLFGDDSRSDTPAR